MKDWKSDPTEPARTRDAGADLEPSDRERELALVAVEEIHERTFQPSMLPMREYFHPSRAELVERREDGASLGVIELHCKLCQRLIVASRDEFILPIAAKAHKCREMRKGVKMAKGKIGVDQMFQLSIILKQKRSRNYES